MRLPRTAIILVLAAAALAGAQPASAQCNPSQACMFAGCWYYLLNNEDFNGSTCSPNWVGASVGNSNLCTDSIYGTPHKVAFLNSSTGAFSQHFTVPNTTSTFGFSMAINFATVGAPSWWDRIVVELWESGVIKETISIRTDQGPFYCHREDFYFSGSYAGKSLDIRVRANLPTPGVEYHVDSIQLFY